MKIAISIILKSMINSFAIFCLNRPSIFGVAFNYNTFIP
ncbi:hypothetical protein AO377_0967 [Moraxella catarrhalis]|nr:hypothetical protein AO377_0967 [Moraxella catarrhalis]OAV36004.1 hypothetical protein AO365_1118 [Moraxella catarrhalis]